MTTNEVVGLVGLGVSIIGAGAVNLVIVTRWLSRLESKIDVIVARQDGQFARIDDRLVRVERRVDRLEEREAA